MGISPRQARKSNRSDKGFRLLSGENGVLQPPFPQIPAHHRIGWTNKRRGVLFLKGNMEERAQRLALYIIENRATVRTAAQKFGISKSTVHKDLAERLPVFNRTLYLQVKGVLEENKAERHIRGGIATRKKYTGA